MAASKYSNPFPPLALSRETKQQLTELAALFVDEAMGHYEAYLLRDQRQLDAARWKFLRQLEDVRVYRERSAFSTKTQTPPPPPPRAPADSASSVDDSSSDMESDHHQQQHNNSSRPATTLPVMLTVGTLVGSLYDTMYGVVNPTLDHMRIKTTYVEDVVVNAAVLETIEAPSHDDPFRSLTVKWAVKGQPLHIRSIVKNRDMVYLEATGLATLPATGERVGYQLLHSVTFPQTPALPTALRGNISICALYRQHGDGAVDVYGKGFLDPTGRILRALVIKSATDVMISVGRNIVCAQQKKLAYALRRRHTPMLTNTPYDHRLQLRNHSKHHHQSGSTKRCGVCTKPFSALAGLGLGKMGHPTQCRLCLQLVCAVCRVKRKLSAISPLDSYLHEQLIPFCLLCVTAVNQTSALDIARDEVAQKDATRGYGGSITSSFSSTTMSESIEDLSSPPRRKTGHY